MSKGIRGSLARPFKHIGLISLGAFNCIASFPHQLNIQPRYVVPRTAAKRRCDRKALAGCRAVVNVMKNEPTDFLLLHENLSNQNGSGLSRSGFLSFAAALAAATVSPPAASASRIEKTQAERVMSVSSNHPMRGYPIALAATGEGSKTLEESISGFIAGAAVSTSKTIVKYPLDTATVRLQMPGTAFSILDPVSLFNGSYRGIISPLISNIPAGSAFFAVKDAAKAALKESGMPKWLATSVAVAVAQPPYWLLRNPSEVVKTKQQAGVEGFGEGVSAVDAFKLVTDESKSGEERGIRGLYTGYWENILYAYPADVIKFVCYENFSRGKKNLPPFEGAMYGAASTAVAQLLTTPLDVVRNRIMAGEKTKKTADSKTNGDVKSLAGISYFDNFVSIAQEEGLAELFAGVIPRVGKALLSGAIQFATYEETKQEIGKLFERQRQRY